MRDNNCNPQILAVDDFESEALRNNLATRGGLLVLPGFLHSARMRRSARPPRYVCCTQFPAQTFGE